MSLYRGTLLLLLKDNPSFNEIGVGAPNRRNNVSYIVCLFLIQYTKLIYLYMTVSGM